MASRVGIPRPDKALGPLNDDYKFFLAKLAPKMTPQNIREHFSQFGSVNFIKIIYDRRTGASCGYGFLYMNDAGGDLAVEKYGARHDGLVKVRGFDGEIQVRTV